MLAGVASKLGVKDFDSYLVQALEYVHLSVSTRRHQIVRVKVFA